MIQKVYWPDGTTILSVFLNDRKFPLLINNQIILFRIGHKLKDNVYSSQ